jgi:hypothetical protein
VAAGDRELCLQLLRGAADVWANRVTLGRVGPTVPGALPGAPEQSGDSHSALTPVPVLTPSPIGQLTPVLWAGQ